MLTDNRSRAQLVDCIVEGGMYSARDALGCYLRSIDGEGYKLPEQEVKKLSESVDMLPNGYDQSESEKAIRRMTTLLCLGDLAVSADGLIEHERVELFRVARSYFNEQFKNNPVKPDELNLSDILARWFEKARLPGNGWLAKVLGLDAEGAIQDVATSQTTHIGLDDMRFIERAIKPTKRIPKAVISGTAIAGLVVFWSGFGKVKSKSK